MKIGGVFQHPQGPIYVTAGQYEGAHGISNFWHWRFIRKDGTLGRKGSGYGRGFPPIRDAKVIIRIEFPKEKS